MSRCSYFTYSIYDSGVAKVLKLFIFLGCLPLNQIFSRQSQWWFVNIILVSSWSPHGVSLKSMHSLTQPSFLICYQFKTTRKVNCGCLSYVQRKKKKIFAFGCWFDLQSLSLHIHLQVGYWPRLRLEKSGWK